MVGDNLIEIGSIIKLQRTKRNMTQEELSEGIVSLSYLSKIENKKTKASPEIIQLLCNRLEIELTEKLDIEIEEKCQEWYGMLYDRFDKQKISVIYEELQQLLGRSINDQTLMFEIHKIRYYCIMRDLKKALCKINELHEMANSFNPIHKYYWHKFQGNYYSFKTYHHQAMQHYKLAEETISFANIQEQEIADLQYIISIEHSKLWNDLETIEYAKKAMGIFQQNYNFIRCAQCHILLGIAHHRIKNLDKATKNYNLALQLGELKNNEDVVHLAHYNLGYLHSITGNSEKAIEHYLIAIQNNNFKEKTKLVSLIRLIQEFYLVGDYEKAKNYLDQTILVLEAYINDYNEYIEDLHKYVIKVYTHLLNGETKQFISVLANDFIPYLEKKRNYEYLAFYAKMLGDHLEKSGKYKSSLQYYKLANSSYEKLFNL